MSGGILRHTQSPKRRLEDGYETSKTWRSSYSARSMSHSTSPSTTHAKKKHLRLLRSNMPPRREPSRANQQLEMMDSVHQERVTDHLLHHHPDLPHLLHLSRNLPHRVAQTDKSRLRTVYRTPQGVTVVAWSGHAEAHSVHRMTFDIAACSKLRASANLETCLQKPSLIWATKCNPAAVRV